MNTPRHAFLILVIITIHQVCFVDSISSSMSSRPGEGVGKSSKDKAENRENHVQSSVLDQIGIDMVPDIKNTLYEGVCLQNIHLTKYLGSKSLMLTEGKLEKMDSIRHQSSWAIDQKESLTDIEVNFAFKDIMVSYNFVYERNFDFLFFQYRRRTPGRVTVVFRGDSVIRLYASIPQNLKQIQPDQVGGDKCLTTKNVIINKLSKRMNRSVINSKTFLQSVFHYVRASTWGVRFLLGDLRETLRNEVVDALQDAVATLIPKLKSVCHVERITSRDCSQTKVVKL